MSFQFPIEEEIDEAMKFLDEETKGTAVTDAEEVTGVNEDNTNPRDTLLSGEPQQEEHPLDPESYDTDHHWNDGWRPPLQRHNELGPSLNAEGRTKKTGTMQDSVNPMEYDWEASREGIDIIALKVKWGEIMAGATEYSEPEKTKDKLNDDLQLLFVTLVLDHAENVLNCIENNTQPTPLYLMLLGTAGSGKTTATQTMLQELQDLLKATEPTSAFCRVAAPTGTEAFNVRFSATTIHRPIKWFNPRFFQALTHPERLAELLAHFDQTQLIVIDEVSMVGRKMMGRMDCRLHQAVADANPRGDAAESGRRLSSFE